MNGRIKIEYSAETERKLDIFIEMRNLLNEGKEVLVLTEIKKELEEVFDKYWQFFNIFIKRGLLIYKSHSELVEEDFEKIMYEL